MNQNMQREGIEVILPREDEIDRQLLPGSVLRDVNLVESVAELRKQMEESNSAIIRAKKRMMLVSAILAVGILFFAFKAEKRTKLAKYLKLIGTAFAVLSLIKGASSQEGKIKIVPSTKDFSHEDKIYSIFKKVNDSHQKSPFMQLAVKAILDVLIASKMIEPYEIMEKQKELRTNQTADLDANIMKAIIQY